LRNQENLIWPWYTNYAVDKLT